MVQFLNRNPAVEGFQAGQRMQDEAQARELRTVQIEDARRRQAEEMAATEALQGIYASRPTPESYDRAAGAPGLNAQTRLGLADRGQQLRQRTTQERETAARDMATFLRAGMLPAAQDAASRAGIQIPETFWIDRAQQAALLQKLEVESKQADIEQKRSHAQFYRGEGRQTGIGGRSSVFQQKVALYKAAYPEKTDAEILDMADGRKPPNIADLRARAFMIAQKATDHLGRPLYKTPDEQRRAADETLQYMLGGAQQAQPGPLGAAPATPPPAAPLGRTEPAAPAPLAQPAPQPSVNVGGVQGTFTNEYRDGKPVYRTPEGRLFVIED